MSGARRGYLLLEAMAGGAILVIVLASCMSLVAVARANTSYGTRRQAAAALARAELDELLAAPTLVGGTQPLVLVDPVKYPGVRLGNTITNVTATYAAQSPGGIKGTLFEIQVDVEVPTAGGIEVLSFRSLRSLR